jgi:hypothetical protein
MVANGQAKRTELLIGTLEDEGESFTFSILQEAYQLTHETSAFMKTCTFNSKRFLLPSVSIYE